jgi:Na+/H+ antiporter NhaD/arsenite permease-like protein
MEILSWEFWLLVAVFVLGYAAIILEYYIKINKTAVALLIAVLCWVIHLATGAMPVSQDLKALGHHVSEVSQIIFFLMGAMTLVELIDSHRGFKVITDRIHTQSKRKMLWIVAFVTFFLSSILDNLTTTILMVSLLRKLVPELRERLLLCCIVVVAANSGGAWTPIGDVTTTMLWINGQLSSLKVMKSLFIPSLVSLIIPVLWYSMRSKGKFSIKKLPANETALQPGGRLVFILGVGGLIFVPIFKALTGLPPFMGVILALSVLWLVTDLMHYPYKERIQLRVPHVLTRVDTSGVLFFLGILLSVDALQTAGILQWVADTLDATLKSQSLIAVFIGLISAVIDNVPLVAATMGMYPLENYPIDSSLWHMIAYAAGTGGSILIIGSSAGVAMMGMEKIDFITYAKKVSIPVLFGFLAGMGIYLFLKPILGG